MDQTQLQQKIAEFYEKLPNEAQIVFSSMKWLETLKQISAKYNLNDQQIETIGIETTLVLLGIIPFKEYNIILKNEIKIPEESITKMITEIDESILKTIKQELTEVFDKNNQLFSEELDERFSELTDESKNAILESNYQTKIYKIGQKYNLTISQMEILEKAIVNIIIGTTNTNEFEESLKQSLQLPNEKNKEIVNEINKKILKEIREKMITQDCPQIENNNVINPIINKEKPIESREELLKKIENPDKTPSILAQKLSGTFQIPKVETNHSLSNVTKNTDTSTKSVDPYREIPE